MSRFNVKRSYKQLIAERNALEFYIQHKEQTLDTETMTVRQAGELSSDQALLAEINQDIELANGVIQCDLEDVYPKRLEGSELHGTNLC